MAFFYRERQELEMLQREFATFPALIDAIYDRDPIAMGGTNSTVAHQANPAQQCVRKNGQFSYLMAESAEGSSARPEAPKDWYIPLPAGTIARIPALERDGRPGTPGPMRKADVQPANPLHPLPAGTFGAVALVGPHQAFRLDDRNGVPPSHPFYTKVKDAMLDYVLPTTHLMNLVKAMEDSWSSAVVEHIETSNILPLARFGTFRIYSGNSFMQVSWLPHHVKRKLQRCSWYCESVLQGGSEVDTPNRKQACYVFLWTCSAIIHEVNKLIALRAHMPHLCGALEARATTLPHSKEHQIAKQEIDKINGVVNMYERYYVNTMIRAMMNAKAAGNNPMRALLNPELMKVLHASVQFQSMVTISTGAGLVSQLGEQALELLM